MKILHVVNRGYDDKTGGGIVKKRNTRILKLLFGEENVYFFEMESKKNKIYTFFKLLLGFYGGNSYQNEKKILNEINDKNVDFIFMDSSLFGRTVKKIKSKNKEKKIMTFFHNIETDFFKSEYKTTKKLKVLLFILVAYYNERLAVKYSDEILVLNERDKKRLIENYKIFEKKIQILPISLETSKNINLNEISKTERFGLFVGSYFYPNVEAVNWLVENILEKINIKIYVVGKDMEKLKYLEEKNEKIKIIGTVPKLEEYYNKSSFVIAPIFSGAGMKVKTAEALMFGKTIFGTTEAFEGYELDYDQVGGLCNTAEDFILKINEFISKEDKAIINLYSLEIFKNHYSDEAILKNFKNILKGLI